MELDTGFEPAIQPWQGRVLTVILHLLERVMGVEPTYPAWKAGVLADVLHLHRKPTRGSVGFRMEIGI